VPERFDEGFFTKKNPPRLENDYDACYDFLVRLAKKSIPNDPCSFARESCFYELTAYGEIDQEWWLRTAAKRRGFNEDELENLPIIDENEQLIQVLADVLGLSDFAGAETKKTKDKSRLRVLVGPSKSKREKRKT
jgi:hypothetical protein